MSERVQRILDAYGYNRATKIAAIVRVLAGVEPKVTHDEIEAVTKQLAEERAEGMRVVGAMLRTRADVMKKRGARMAWIELETAAASIERKATRL